MLLHRLFLHKRRSHWGRMERVAVLEPVGCSRSTPRTHGPRAKVVPVERRFELEGTTVTDVVLTHVGHRLIMCTLFQWALCRSRSFFHIFEGASGLIVPSSTGVHFKYHGSFA